MIRPLSRKSASAFSPELGRDFEMVWRANRNVSQEKRLMATALRQTTFCSVALTWKSPTFLLLSIWRLLVTQKTGLGTSLSDPEVRMAIENRKFERPSSTKRG